jgi:hypothetical protein
MEIYEPTAKNGQKQGVCVTEDFCPKPDAFVIGFVYCQQREHNDDVCGDNDEATTTADRIY